jgi:DNA-binding MarR family transcriptional regulator
VSAASEPASRGRNEPPPLGAVLEFMRTLWRLDHALQRASKHMSISLGVTGPQRLVLRIVGRFPGILAGQLAEILHVHPSTLTGMLKRLERQDLVRRRTDPRDRRRALLGLTARGRRVESRAEGSVEAAVRRVLGELPEATTENAAELLSEIASRLEAELPE